jgi:hypothetical protein
MDQQSGFVDRETQTEYPDARSLVNAYIARFSQRVSAATGTDIHFEPLDEKGATKVSRGSATVNIHVLDEHGILMFLRAIMKVPQKNPEKLYRRLLELNFSATSDGAFAVDKTSETVYLRALRSLAGLA